MPTLIKESYGGWPTCYRLTNYHVELVVTGDVGPRIIRFGLVGGDNLFYERPETLGAMGGDKWLLYGGHRLWHAPEHPVRTYQPDNQPVQVEETANGVRVTPANEAATGIQKQVEIEMDEASAHVRLVHRLTNTGAWPIELAPWALSVMAGGGTAIVPLPPRGKHPDDLLPTTQISLWPYTDMADSRWTWGTRYVLLRQADALPQKIGIAVTDGWLAYARGGELFVKRFAPLAPGAYPDRGSNVEVFTNAMMLEAETLGPLTTLAPGASVEHVEDWYLFTGATVPSSDADVERDILPLVAQTNR